MNEVIPANDNIIATNDSPEYTLETLPPLLPQQQLMLMHILNGNDYVTAYRKAGYQAQEQYQGRAAEVLVTRNPLKAHLVYFQQELRKHISPDYIANKLRVLMHESSDSDNPARYNSDAALKAMDMLNKMGGFYAATQVNVQNVTASIEDIRNARAEYKQEK